MLLSYYRVVKNDGDPLPSLKAAFAIDPTNLLTTGAIRDHLLNLSVDEVKLDEDIHQLLAYYPFPEDAKGQVAKVRAYFRDFTYMKKSA